MRRIRKAAATSAAVLAMTGGAWAACPQALAAYGDAAKAAEIVFAGALGEADGMLHRFAVTFADSGLTMDGVVMLAGEPDRPWGIIMHQCPEGDATGAEIAACTVWQGPIYSIDGQGRIGWLPVAAQPPAGDAAEALLLPDFNAALMQSAAWQEKQITSLPGDAYRLTACQE